MYDNDMGAYEKPECSAYDQIESMPRDLSLNLRGSKLGSVGVLPSRLL